MNEARQPLGYVRIGSQEYGHGFQVFSSKDELGEV